MDDGVLIGAVIVEVFFLIVRVWALVRAIGRPDWAFSNAGKNKPLWLILLIVGLFLPCLGYIVALWYLFSTDRQVRAEQHLGRGIRGPSVP
jgi:hypothetical protein